jgi:hypothetical protein
MTAQRPGTARKADIHPAAVSQVEKLRRYLGFHFESQWVFDRRGSNAAAARG